MPKWHRSESFEIEIMGVNRETLFWFRWSKREEQDFYRTISLFGIVRDPTTGQYDWSKFRHVLTFLVVKVFVRWKVMFGLFRVLAKLEKKGNDRLSQYCEEFLEMCHAVCNKGKSSTKHTTGIFKRHVPSLFMILYDVTQYTCYFIDNLVVFRP